MPEAPLESTYQQTAPLRRRVAGIVLTLIAEALLVLMLLGLAVRAPAPTPPPRLTTFQVMPEADTSEKTVATKKSGATAGPKAPRAPTTPPPTPIPPPPDTPPPPLNILLMPHDVMAQADISKLPTRPGPPAGGGGRAGTGAGPDTGDAGPGTGPNGEPLYNAEWYREPSNAELATYMPHHPGWGMVACRTVARFHVEDCIEIAESPQGSGMSRGVRQAAWQFLVRPPRVGGHLLVGAWVRIRIDFTETGKKDG